MAIQHEINNTTQSAALVILAYLKDAVPKQVYQKGDTLAEVAYKQGQLDFIAVIERQFIGGA